MAIIMAEREPATRLDNINREEFDRVFLIALLLTGHVDDAEMSMLEAMDCESHGRRFLHATIRVAVRRARRIDCDAFERNLSGALSVDPIWLPLELRRVLLLPIEQRHCFVLRTLVGLAADQCSHLLHLPERDVKANAVYGAVLLAVIRQNEDDRGMDLATVSSARLSIPN